MIGLFGVFFYLPFGSLKTWSGCALDVIFNLDTFWLLPEISKNLHNCSYNHSIKIWCVYPAWGLSRISFPHRSHLWAIVPSVRDPSWRMNTVTKSMPMVRCCNPLIMASVVSTLRRKQKYSYLADDISNSRVFLIDTSLKCVTLFPTVIYVSVTPSIARIIEPTWDPLVSCRPQMGPMLAPWNL